MFIVFAISKLGCNFIIFWGVPNLLERVVMEGVIKGKILSLRVRQDNISPLEPLSWPASVAAKEGTEVTLKSILHGPKGLKK